MPYHYTKSPSKVVHICQFYINVTKSFTPSHQESDVICGRRILHCSYYSFLVSRSATSEQHSVRYSVRMVSSHSESSLSKLQQKDKENEEPQLSEGPLSSTSTSLSSSANSLSVSAGSIQRRVLSSLSSSNLENLTSSSGKESVTPEQLERFLTTFHTIDSLSQSIGSEISY